MFIFNAVAELSDPNLRALEFFKNVNALREVRLKSKEFVSYKECVDSAHALIDFIRSEAVTKEFGKFSIQTNVNPKFGQDEEADQTESLRWQGAMAEWHDSELSRFYLINDEKSNGGDYVTNLVISIYSLKKQQKDH